MVSNTSLTNTLGSYATNATLINNYYTRTDTDSAISSAVSTLSSAVGNNTAALQVAAQSIDGLEAQYTVKIDNNGYVTGFGLASTLVNSTPFSEFIVRADRFAISSVGQVEVVPFVVTTSTTTLNGVSVPAGVYIDQAYIKNGAISSAKIGNAAVDTAQIANAAITNAKIDNLAVNSAKISDAAITNAKIDNLAVSEAKIQNLAVTQAKIADLAVDTLKIADQAVTLPVSAQTVDALTLTTNQLWNTVQSLTIAATGDPVKIAFSIILDNESGTQRFCHVKLRKNTSTILLDTSSFANDGIRIYDAEANIISYVYDDTSGDSGNQTYYVDVRRNGTWTGTFRVRYRVLTAVVLKK